MASKEDIEKKPWKYIGYGGFAPFISSSDDFFFVRKFGTLHARVLLALQDQLVQLEDKLNGLDTTGVNAQPDQHNGSLRQDEQHFRERPRLIAEIHQKLKDYNDLVLQHSEIRAHPKVSQRNLTSVINWLTNKENAIARAETVYLDHSSDLVPLTRRHISPLRRLLKRSERFRLMRFWRTTPVAYPLCDAEEHVHYHSDERIDNFVTILILLLGIAMLIAPLWILGYVHDPETQCGIITIFIVLFLGLLSFTTVAKPFESLAAAAAYSAVLVVFLQNAPQ